MDNVTSDHPAGGDTPPIDPFARITGAPSPKPKPDDIWEPQLPAVGEPSEANHIRHSKYGVAGRLWVYRDAAGAPLFCVVRFEPKKPDGTPDKKQVIPYSYGRLVWTTLAGRRKDVIGWHFKRPAVPVPLYGLDRLASKPDARVLLCEGEKSADAAEIVFPNVVAIASQGGGNAPEVADWAPLAGRDVTIWPDADAAGAKFVRQAAELLQEAGAGRVRVVRIVLTEWPAKWDLADALPPGIPAERLIELFDGATEPAAPSAPADEGVVDEEASTSSEDFIAEVVRLGGLSEFDYSRARKAAADAWSISVRELDAAVKNERLKQQRAAISPETIAEEIDRLSRLPRAGYARDRKAAAQKLLLGVADLDSAVNAERAKRRNAAEAECRAKPPPEPGETRWPMGVLPCADGLYMDTGADTGPIWLCAPIVILGEGRDPSGESWSLYLKWHDRDGIIHTWSMPKRMLMVTPGELEAALVERGLNLEVDAGARGLLRQALNGVKSGSRITLVAQPGWHAPGNGDNAFCLLNGETIGEAAETLVLKTQSENANQKMAFAGTLEEWKSDIAAKAEGNPVAAFVICAAFTGPLLDPLAESSGGFHFFGRSKTGKTLIMRMALSVWGAPKKSGLLRDWRSTANALEGAAEECNDGLLPLDEIHQCEPKDVVAAIYQLANEGGKGRLHRDTSSRQRKTWRIIVISTGEVDVATMAGKAGQKLPAGAEVRLPSIHLDGRDMWPDLHGAPSPVALMAELQAALPRQFGTAIRAFLNNLTAARNDANSELDATVEALRDRFYAKLPAEHDPQVRDVARRCALVAAAGEMAIEWDILPWKAGEATAAAEVILEWWLNRRGGAGSTEESQHVKAVRAFLSEFGSSRFVGLDWVIEPSNNKGHWVERHPDRPVQSRAGWKRSNTDGDQYLITPDSWHDLCSKAGVDPVETAKTLEAAKFLVTTGDNKNLTKPIKVPGMPKTRFYVIDPSIFVGDTPTSAAQQAAE